MGSAKLVELSMENVSEFIESNRVAILDFWGSDCGVCVAMLPVLEGCARTRAILRFIPSIV